MKEQERKKDKHLDQLQNLLKHPVHLPLLLLPQLLLLQQLLVQMTLLQVLMKKLQAQASGEDASRIQALFQKLLPTGANGTLEGHSSDSEQELKLR